MTPWLSREGLGDAPTIATVFDSHRIVSGSRTSSGYARRMRLRAVVFDVDFTIAQPGPDLGPDGYRRPRPPHGPDPQPARDARGPGRPAPGGGRRGRGVGNWSRARPPGGWSTTRRSGSSSRSGSCRGWAA